jgi:hypothetical protein
MTNIRKLEKSKTFWPFIAIVLTVEVLVFLGVITEIHLNIFQGVIGILILGIFPAMIAMVVSVRAAVILKWIHQNVINITNRTHLKYYVDSTFTEKESYRRFAAYNIWYTTGITFILLQISGINFENTTSMMTLTMLYVFNGLIFASSINFAIFLIKKKSIFFENNIDGSKINLGSDLKKIINSGLAPIQILVFLYPLVTEFNIIIPFFISLGMTLGICFIASLTSYFVLKRHYIEKLHKRFESKLKL